MAKFYITTTLPYVNSEPHIGFGLEVVQADALARYRRLMGDEVFFNTGTDEHGQKIYEKAQQAGKDTQTYVDQFASTFEALKQSLNLSYDAFIRTTSPAHKAAAQEFWRRCDASGDIYKKAYQVKYCVGCELEKSDSELVHGECPLHPGKQLELRDEENYFFRLSKYQDKLLALYSQEGFLIPQFRINEMTSLITREGLQDFSISRPASKMSWGVPVPGDESHVMYVWFDALVNYISTLGWPTDPKWQEFWPGVQVAGKDQVRQQACMWQAMLMSAGVLTTKQIFIHGFINVAGVKMSKSLGNFVQPIELVSKYGTDAVRYYLLRHINPTEDSEFSIEKFEEAYNAGLANGLGNLVARIMKLAEDNLDGPIAKPDVQPFPDALNEAMGKFEFNKAMDYIWHRIQLLDQRITTEAPFSLIKSDPVAGKALIADLVTELYWIGRYLNPFMPATNELIKSTILANKKPESLFARIDVK